MANVLFKRGLQANLPSGNNIIDGTLYFTTDTKRLFLGQDNSGTKVLLPIAEGITTITDISALPTASQHEGEFYFDSTRNILAVAHNGTWQQINPDTKLDSSQSSFTVDSVVDNIATLKMIVADTSGIKVTKTLEVVGGDNVDLEKDGTQLVINSTDTNTTYTLGAETGNITVDSSTASGLTVNLTPSTGTGSAVEFYSSNNSVSFDANNDGQINLTVNADRVSGLRSVTGGAGALDADGTAPATGGNNGFYVDVELTSKVAGNNYQHLAGNIDPIIQIKNGRNSWDPATIHFVKTSNGNGYDGIAQLDVLSTSAVLAEIEEAKKVIDAMQYQGGLASKAALTTLENNHQLHNGDVFVATDNFGSGSSYLVGGKEVKTGYLIIVQGQETNGVITGTPTYTVVKANDTDTTYSVSSVTSGNGISIVRSTDSESIGGIEIKGANGLAISNSTSAAGITEVTVSHPLDRGTDPAVTTQSVGSGATTFNVVTAIGTNARGHVETVTTKTIDVSGIKTQLGTGSTEVEVTNSVATITSTVVAGISPQHNEMEEELAFSIGSSSLTLAEDGSDASKLNIDIVWGSF